MAYTFFKARGVPVGKSLVEDDLLDAARDVEARAKARGLRLELPVDHVVAPKLEAGAPAETLDVGDPAIGDRMGLDIGPKTIATLSRGASPTRRRWSGTARWACSRSTRSRKGTIGVAQAVADVQGHDDHRRRRLDRGGRQGRRRRSDHAHLDRRRRVARVPRRPDAAGRGRARRSKLAGADMRTPFIAANWKMYKTVHEAVAFVKEFRSAGRRTSTTSRSSSRRRSRRCTRWPKRRARVEHRRRRAEPALGARGRVHRRGQRRDAQGGRAPST